MTVSKLAKSEVCRSCARCCKTFGMLFDRDTAKRFIMMDERKIKVEEIEVSEGNFYYLVTFKYPCNKLKHDREGKYYCSIYDDKESDRPQFCKEYPDNIPISLIEHDAKECPLLDKLLKAKLSRL
ncbi:MAG: YkgJ family cysteine cluster protein [Candidatus Woesearchaeota archaeon]|nr:YkgJ family cysteine cluster protein [Candidatus Woesearchaeota archaeon]